MNLKKTMNEKVSVIMSVYNSEQTLVNSIESIINQTYSNLEILICDDCSTDDSLKILETYESQDKRIQIIKNKENIGLTKSLNKLINKATGKYIARQDADDVSLEYRIETQISVLKKSKSKISVSRALVKNSNKLIPYFSYIFPYTLVFKIKNPFIHGTLIIEKSLLNEIGNYDELFYYAQDYKLYQTIIDKRIKIKKLYKPLYILNTENNISKNYYKEQKYYADCVKSRIIPSSDFES